MSQEETQADSLDPTSNAGGNESDSSVIETLRAEVAEAQERAFRIAAELDNFRKRMRREAEEAARYAELPVLRDLLAVQDNLQRAIDAAGAAEVNGGVVEGVRMVAQQLDQLLRNHHCEPIPAVGETFDPNFHEALRTEPSDEHAANVVSRELRVGYRLHDRVIRPAQVFVSTGPTGG